MANATLLSELAGGGVLSTPAQNYVQKVVKRSERTYVKNTIIKEEYTKLREAVTKKETILSGKRKVIDGKHILITSEILSGLIDAERKTKKRKTNTAKKSNHKASQVMEEFSDESKSCQSESLTILDCIEVEQ